MESLRRKIPSKKDCRVKQFTPDPTLDVRESYHGEWERYYEEAAKLLLEFNKALQHAIAKDKDSEDDLGNAFRLHGVFGAQLATESVRSGDLGLQKHVDDVKQEWVEKYFSGGCHSKRWLILMTLQARHPYNMLMNMLVRQPGKWFCIIIFIPKLISLRYFYGYGKGKTAFAWLGARQLNMMKAGKSALPCSRVGTNEIYSCDKQRSPSAACRKHFDTLGTHICPHSTTASRALAVTLT